MSRPKLSRTGVFDFFLFLGSEVGVNKLSLSSPSLLFSSGKDVASMSWYLSVSLAIISLNCSFTTS